jgi:hypothetical protein
MGVAVAEGGTQQPAIKIDYLCPPVAKPERVATQCDDLAVSCG